MKVFTCIDHQDIWPVGVASVIIANDEAQAKELLVAELVNYRIIQTEPFTLQELDLTVAKAVVLQNGEY